MYINFFTIYFYRDDRVVNMLMSSQIELILRLLHTPYIKTKSIPIRVLARVIHGIKT